ncbi:MAG: YfiR family protein [Telluria sp.]
MLSPPMPWAPRAACATSFGAGKPGRAMGLLAFALGSLLLALSCLTAFGAQSGADAGSLERNVKAAFLYKFLGYIDYPDSAVPVIGEPLVIGVLGAADVADELRRISHGRSMNGRAVMVRKLRANEAPGKLHILFVGEEDVADVEKTLAAVRHSPVLTVTETARNLRHDSVINFRVVEERVRFEVSLDAAGKSNLKLSSRLLAVAYKVQRSAR